jgi:hypothetical protein
LADLFVGQRVDQLDEFHFVVCSDLATESQTQQNSNQNKILKILEQRKKHKFTSKFHRFWETAWVPCWIQIIKSKKC